MIKANLAKAKDAKLRIFH